MEIREKFSDAAWRHFTAHCENLHWTGPNTAISIREKGSTRCSREHVFDENGYVSTCIDDACDRKGKLYISLTYSFWEHHAKETAKSKNWERDLPTTPFVETQWKEGEHGDL